MIITVVLLVVALEPARRRAKNVPPTAPGDRDAARVRAELAALPRAERMPRRLARMLAAAGAAVPMHRAPINAEPLVTGLRADLNRR